MNCTPVRVLVVEDNPSDAFLATELIKETGIPTDITIVEDGEMAISALEKAVEGRLGLPGLILLDINLPKKNGHEVLKFVQRAHLANTYVAIYTGSSSPDDAQNAMDHGADAYIIKPIGSKEMERTVQKFRQILTDRSKISP